MKVTLADLEVVSKVAATNERVAGFTHDYYNYPARFSPLLAREIITHFTKPGDLVLDPFMGSATTLVEAKLLNRKSIGFDISTLSAFLADVKLNPLNTSSFEISQGCISSILGELNCHLPAKRPVEWIEKGYQRNLSNKKTWPIRKLIEQFLFQLTKSALNEREMNFFRCVLLKTSQWALDSRKLTPSATAFRSKIAQNFETMVSGSREFWERGQLAASTIVNAPADKVHENAKLFKRAPKLVLTSPPYPGVHVMYHRWQVFGRRETPAPFWIANSSDGHGLSHYTMGDRHQKRLTSYFQNIKNAFESIQKVCDSNTLIVQVLAFSDLKWQLRKYLQTMNKAGFTEIDISKERIWRTVPNRKWYAQQKGSTNSSKEVILFHKLTR